MRHERLRGVAVAALSFSIKQYTCLVVSTENVMLLFGHARFFGCQSVGINMM